LNLGRAIELCDDRKGVYVEGKLSYVCPHFWENFSGLQNKEHIGLIERLIEHFTVELLSTLFYSVQQFSLTFESWLGQSLV